ncbi:MAG: prepilin peptidase, partial [Myxococcales bacterium]|nr:prepilin peptidase [Myxococcales bacterium]
ILGASLGSFAGVIISRWPLGISIVWQKSFCASCQRPLKIWHNVPILSYLYLRGRCAFCKKFYGIRPLVIELLCAFCLLALYIKLGFSFALLERFIFFFVLLCLAYIDIDTFCLPYSLLAALIITGVVFSIIYYYFPSFWVDYYGLKLPIPLVFSSSGLFSLQDRVLGALSGGGIFATINLVATFILRKQKRLLSHQWAMGWGDPILLSGIALFVGLSHLLLVIFLASAMGALLGILQKFIHKAKEEEKFEDDDVAQGALPYGPFLAIAGIFVYLL